MSRKTTSLSDSDSPGIASQGPTGWVPGGPPVEIEAVTDFAYTIPGHPVTIDALANDIGDNIYIESIEMRDVTDGTANTGGMTITFNPSNTKFASLNYGEYTDVTFDYTIRDGVGRTDTGYIVVRITRQYDVWADEDDAWILDQDDYAIVAYPDLITVVWLDQDGLFFIDQDEAVIDLEGT
jgi:hypothetical protein